MQLLQTREVSVPYEITLLSNLIYSDTINGTVSVPYEITLLSNVRIEHCAKILVSVPYEITLLSNHMEKIRNPPPGFSTL